MDAKMDGKSHVKQRTILASVVASAVTALVVVTVVISLYYGTHLCDGDATKPQRTQFQKFTFAISESQSTGKVVVKTRERVIITETSDPDENLDDTVAIQDFNRGLQAVYDKKKKHCYVLELNQDFEYALQATHGNHSGFNSDDGPVPMPKYKSKEAIPTEFLNHALGDHIGDFCSGVPTYWLIDAPSTGASREKRSVPKPNCCCCCCCCCCIISVEAELA